MQILGILCEKRILRLWQRVPRAVEGLVWDCVAHKSDIRARPHDCKQGAFARTACARARRLEG